MLDSTAAQQELLTPLPLVLPLLPKLSHNAIGVPHTLDDSSVP
jgi:hypothetical protein